MLHCKDAVGLHPVIFQVKRTARDGKDWGWAAGSRHSTSRSYKIRLGLTNAGLRMDIHGGEIA